MNRPETRREERLKFFVTHQDHENQSMRLTGEFQKFQEYHYTFFLLLPSTKSGLTYAYGCSYTDVDCPVIKVSSL
jgi:hypothetical protein